MFHQNQINIFYNKFKKLCKVSKQSKFLTNSMVQHVQNVQNVHVIPQEIIYKYNGFNATFQINVQNDQVILSFSQCSIYKINALYLCNINCIYYFIIY